MTSQIFLNEKWTEVSSRRPYQILCVFSTAQILIRDVTSLARSGSLVEFKIEDSK